MIRKLVAIALAVLINCAALAWFHDWSKGSVANATPPPQRTGKVVMLPVLTVRPTRAQLELLRREDKPIEAGSAPIPGAVRAMHSTSTLLKRKVE